MSNATPKNDQLRAMRERAYEARLASPAYDGTRDKLAKQEKLAKARAANADVNRKRRAEKAAT
jgi:hypothetical protein